MTRPRERVIVVGAGVGGLSAAVQLAAQGALVTVIERADTPGGKLREVRVGDCRIDAGPTVLTMREVLEAVFDSAGASLDDYVPMSRATVLARHGWERGGRLDLFDDTEHTVDAIGEFAGLTEARNYLAFCREARNIYRILEQSFMQASKPSLPQLMWRIGPHRLRDQWRINPYQTLWSAVCRHFKDERLRQLFARYATYCGSSPFATPATLMLIADVERRGVWLVQGGMYKIALALEQLGTRLGVEYRYACEVCDVTLENKRASGVMLTTGERLEANAVIVNADVAAVAEGRLGRTAAQSVRPISQRSRSLSAHTWAFTGSAAGFPLARHTIFFPDAPYENEFNDIFGRKRLPLTPAVYVCAQDRDSAGHSSTATDRFLCIVNAPPVEDGAAANRTEIEECETKAYRLMNACGLTLQQMTDATVRTSPRDFERLFPGTAGAIYGRASHGWMSSFQRQGARCRVPGLYFAGGSAHPGPGVPMAALSGTLACNSVLADLASIRKLHKTATPGGMLMPSATTAATD